MSLRADHRSARQSGEAVPSHVEGSNRFFVPHPTETRILKISHHEEREDHEIKDPAFASSGAVLTDLRRMETADKRRGRGEDRKIVNRKY